MVFDEFGDKGERAPLDPKEMIARAVANEKARQQARLQEAVRTASEDVERQGQEMRAETEALKKLPLQERTEEAIKAMYPYFQTVMSYRPTKEEMATDLKVLFTAGWAAADWEVEKAAGTRPGLPGLRPERMDALRKGIQTEVEAAFAGLVEGLRLQKHKPQGYKDIDAAWAVFRQGLEEAMRTYVVFPTEDDA